MGKMTIEQIAQRAAKKKNRKIAERYPMFADVFATTPTAEKERIEKQHWQAERWIVWMRENSRRMWRKGMALKEVARDVLAEDEWNARERLWKRWHEDATDIYDGDHLTDFWWQSLKGTEWAFTHCPNADKHSLEDWWQPHWDFLRNDFVETVECPTCGMQTPKWMIKK